VDHINVQRFRGGHVFKADRLCDLVHDQRPDARRGRPNLLVLLREGRRVQGFSSTLRLKGHLTFAVGPVWYERVL